MHLVWLIWNCIMNSNLIATRWISQPSVKKAGYDMWREMVDEDSSLRACRQAGGPWSMVRGLWSVVRRLPAVHQARRIIRQTNYSSASIYVSFVLIRIAKWHLQV